MDKFKEMEKAMEERVRQLETRVENIDKRHDQSQPTPRRSDRLAFESDTEVPAMGVHVKALEICSEELLEHMLPHIDAILTEMERRVPAIYLSPLTPPAAEATQIPSSAGEATQPTPAKRNKPPKRNRRPLSGNFTPMSVADSPLSPPKGSSPPLLPTPPLSPTSVTLPSSQSPPRAVSNGYANSQASTTGQKPLQAAGDIFTTKSSLLNTVFAPLPRSSAASAGSQSPSQTISTVTSTSINGIAPAHPKSSVYQPEASGTLHATPSIGPHKQDPFKKESYVLTPLVPMQAAQFQSATGSATSKFPLNSMSSYKTAPSTETSLGASSQTPPHPVAVISKASLNGVNASYNSTQLYSTTGSGQTALTTTTANASSYGHASQSFPPHSGSIGQLQQAASSQTPPRTGAPSNGLLSPATTKPSQVATQAGSVNASRLPTSPTSPQAKTSAANTIAQLSSIANLITTPSVKTTSTGAIPRHVAAPAYSAWLEPLQPQLTESALTAQRLANVKKSIPASPTVAGYPQTSTLATSNTSTTNTERQVVPSSAVALAGSPEITGASSSANSFSVSGAEKFSGQASSLVEPSPIAERPGQPSFSILQTGARQVPTSSIPSLLPGAQQLVQPSSPLNLQPETEHILGPTALLSLQPSSPGTQANPSASVPTSTTVTRPSILKDEPSASRQRPTTQDPFAQPAPPKQVRFSIPPSPTTDHPLVDLLPEPPSTPTSSPSVESESGERVAFTGPLSFAEATDLLKSSAISGHAEEVRRALDAGASIDAADAHGQRALHWAAWCDHAKIVEVLVRRGADLELRNDLGLTALHMAARGGSAQCVAFLLDAGVQVDAQANNRRTALHLAAAKGCEAVVQVLLACGADKSLLDGEGKSAFDLAVTDDIRELLIY